MAPHCTHSARVSPRFPPKCGGVFCFSFVLPQICPVANLPPPFARSCCFLFANPLLRSDVNMTAEDGSDMERAPSADVKRMEEQSQYMVARVMSATDRRVARLNQGDSRASSAAHTRPQSAQEIARAKKDEWSWTRSQQLVLIVMVRANETPRMMRLRGVALLHCCIVHVEQSLATLNSSPVSVSPSPPLLLFFLPPPPFPSLSISRKHGSWDLHGNTV